MAFSPEEFAKKRIATLQDYAILSAQAFANLFRRPLYMADMMTQADLIGVGSLPIVILTGFFTGGVLALQSASSLAQFGAKTVTGELVSLSMIKELGPVLTSLMLTGRNASGMASELGSMKVTEQVDAMRALGTDPIKKLVTPRVIATIVMCFFLTIVSDGIGIAGGGAVSVSMLGLDASQYFHNAYQTLRYPDVIQGLFKPLVFGYIIATVGCFFGMTTKGGTQGVGRSTTQAVVVASVLIIAVDFLVSRVMIGIFGQITAMRTHAERVPSEEEIAKAEHPVIFDDVTIGFEGKPVLDNISFTLRKGETRVLLGPAGSGKSVLLKMANGLILPDSGAVKLFGLITSDLTEQDLLELRRYVGMVFQESALFDSLTVRDNVGYRLEEERDTEEEVTQRVQQALDFVELGQTMNKFPPELSGGMRRRVAIARAIITKPEVILYDSPTGGLDPITSTTIIELVVKQRDLAQTTSIVVTHRLQDAFLMATHRFDREQNKMIALPDGQLDPNTSFMVLHEGKMVFEGDTKQFVTSDDPFLKEFLA